MFGLGPPELIVILLILVVLFGATRIPKIARALGSSISEFRDGLKPPRRLKSLDSEDNTRQTPSSQL